MSRLPVELFLALRYLRPKRTLVSRITLITIVGVTLGVAVLIIVISVMSGFDRMLREKILGFNAHLRVVADGGTMDDYRQIIPLLDHPDVLGAAPLVWGPVLMETQPATGNAKVMAPYLRGIDPSIEHRVSILPSSIREGEFDVRGNGLLVGIELARALDLRVGDPLSIYSVRSLKQMRDSRQRQEEEIILPADFEVRGIFDVGYFDFNMSVVVASLANAQDLYDLGDTVHGILVMLRDPFRVDDVRRSLLPHLPEGVGIRTWYEENSGILDALMVEKNVMFYILFFIMIVAAFGITSALFTFVVHKTSDIGVLKALGAAPAQIMGLFLFQSLTVGLAGVLSGLGLGLLGLHYRNPFLHAMNRITGFELFPAQIYSFSELPALIVPQDIALICGSSLALCLLAGVLPARHAARLNPVDALRHE